MPGFDLPVLMAAVVGHHLKASHETFGKRMVESRIPVSMQMNAPEVKKCLSLAAGILGSEAPAWDNGSWRWEIQTILRHRTVFRQEAQNFRAALASDDHRNRLLVAVKAALIAADSLGSAYMRESVSVEAWVRGCFGDETLTPAWVNESIILPRIREIEQRQGRTFHWQDFQKAAASLGPRALLLSACGTGKTLAAWKWAQSRLGKNDASRVIFLYPTRATATEGFRDYVSWAGATYAALKHGTSEYDLGGMFGNPGDPRSEGDYGVQERLFALAYWPKRVFSATVDSFLAFMRNQYASICMLPVLCDSVVVIDEVHSFDRSMFTALERFLNFFDVPVLCMTATLPTDRKRVLEEHCKLDVFPAELNSFEDLVRQAELPRYALTVEKYESIPARVTQALRDNKKILWVVNQVKRCQEVARSMARDHPDEIVICYHSRFRLMDRKERHELVMKTFQTKPGPLLLVTTQVCEMSLDIDADILITETAPVSSLIQRMGRCCREPAPRNERMGRVICYRADGYRPYEAEEMKQGEAFLRELMAFNRPLSQADLAAYLEQMDVLSPFAKGGYTGFLDGGMYAMGKDESFREATDYTVDAVLDTEVKAYVRLRNSGDRSAAGFVLPVPKRFATRNEALGTFIHEAAASHYCRGLGFCEWEVTHD